MSESLRMWTEVVFNILYLVTIWCLVICMKVKFKKVEYRNVPTANCFLWAYFFLALGDTGHVGFRVFAYLNGGLEKYKVLIGNGALATAVTVTIFYVLMIFVWKNRYNKNLNLFVIILLIAAAVRIMILFMPANEWSSLTPPFKWSLYRNIPLVIQGLGAAFLILFDSIKRKDTRFKWISYMIFISYACYTPVILLVQKIPEIGMLMIPKTIAYLAAAFIGYDTIFLRGK